MTSDQQEKLLSLVGRLLSCKGRPLQVNVGRDRRSRVTVGRYLLPSKLIDELEIEYRRIQGGQTNRPGQSQGNGGPV